MTRRPMPRGPLSRRWRIQGSADRQGGPARDSIQPSHRPGHRPARPCACRARVFRTACRIAACMESGGQSCRKKRRYTDRKHRAGQIRKAGWPNRYSARGRGGKIRTCDLRFPKPPRYQAAPRPDGRLLAGLGRRRKPIVRAPRNSSPGLLAGPDSIGGVY